MATEMVLILLAVLLGFALFPMTIALVLFTQNKMLIKVEKGFKKAAEQEPAHDPTTSSS